MMLIIIAVVVFLVWQHFKSQKARRRAELYEAQRELEIAKLEYKALPENSTAVQISEALMKVAVAQDKVDDLTREVGR